MTSPPVNSRPLTRELLFIACSVSHRRRVPNGVQALVTDAAAVPVSMLQPEGLDRGYVDFSPVAPDPPAHFPRY